MSGVLRDGTTDLGRPQDVPATGTHLVDRPRLTAALAAEAPLVLVVAPAGSGKTVAVAGWAAQVRGPLAWVSFDAPELRGDASWEAIVAALRRCGVRVPPLVSLGGGGERAVPAMLGAHVAAHPDTVVLVLDCAGPVPTELADGLERVLRQSRDRLRVVVLSRTDPPMSLLRRRLSGSVTELRAADLAFRPDEVAALLADAGLGRSAAATGALHVTTGGWAVGLRLAVLDAVRRGDASVVGTASGSAAGGAYLRSIGAYLRAEVTDALPAAEHRLLLDCSVVDELPPGLVDVLGGSAHGLDPLGLPFVEESGQHPGGLVLPPVVREALYAELTAHEPERARALHRRAARWLAGAGRLEEATAQAVRADAWADAARYAVESGLVGGLLLGALPTGATAPLGRMPIGTAGVDAAIVLAVAAVNRGDLATATTRMARARSVRGTVRQPSVDVALGLLELVVASGTGDAAGAVAAADRVAPIVGRPDLAAAVHALRGDAMLVLGRLDEAAADYRASGARRGRHAVVEALRGELRAAQSLADRAAAGSDAVDPCAALASAWVSAEGDDLEVARAHLRRAGHPLVTAADPVPGTLVALLDARLRRAAGDPDGAREALAVPHAAPGWLADLVLLEHAALDLDLGRPWAALERHAAVSDPTSAGAQRLLWRVRLAEWASASRDPKVDASLTARVEGWLLEASRHLSRGEEAAARRAVHRALSLAAPEQLRRPFREATPDVRRLLLDERSPRPATRRVPVRPSGPAGGSVGDLVEQLTGKEREVLGHLAAMLSTDEIAAAMFVSVNTVRTHVRNILRKLGVARRNDAVRRARALHLLPA